jgi:hypothetical protein
MAIGEVAIRYEPSGFPPGGFSLFRIRREHIGDLAAQPAAKRFERCQRDILPAVLNSLERRAGAPRRIARVADLGIGN